MKKFTYLSVVIITVCSIAFGGVHELRRIDHISPEQIYTLGWLAGRKYMITNSNEPSLEKFTADIHRCWNNETNWLYETVTTVITPDIKEVK